MTSHYCNKCGGRRFVCATCRTNHANQLFGTKCRGKRKIPCPGWAPRTWLNEPESDRKPCFDPWVECDVCRIEYKGMMYEQRWGRTERSVGLEDWTHADVPTKVTTPEGKEETKKVSYDLCGECSKRHEEIKRMTLEYLVEERGQINAGKIHPAVKKVPAP